MQGAGAASLDCGTSCKIWADRANVCRIGNADAWVACTLMKRKAERANVCRIGNADAWVACTHYEELLADRANVCRIGNADAWVARTL